MYAGAGNVFGRLSVRLDAILCVVCHCTRTRSIQRRIPGQEICHFNAKLRNSILTAEACGPIPGIIGKNWRSEVVCAVHAGSICIRSVCGGCYICGIGV